MTWRICVTREEPELLTNIRDFETQVLWMVRVVYQEWLRHAICNMKSWLSHLWCCFLQTLFLMQEQFIKKSTCIFLIFLTRENEIFHPWTVILYFLGSWTGPETPPCTTLSGLQHPLAHLTRLSVFTRELVTLVCIYIHTTHQVSVMSHCLLTVLLQDPSTSWLNWMTVLSPFCEQGFRQFCKVLGMFVKAPDVTYFWHRGLGACPPPGNFLKRTLRNVVSSVSGNPSISFPGKAGVHSNCL